jgi:hypothetical protein
MKIKVEAHGVTLPSYFVGFTSFEMFCSGKMPEYFSENVRPAIRLNLLNMFTVHSRIN